MIYFIADMHLNHDNIIRHCKRPFQNAKEMNEVLERNWNGVVRDEDDVYILGDLYFKDSTGVVDILKRLKGRKYFILGNHDRINNEIAKQFVWVKIYHEMYVDDIPFILFHYPIESWNKSFHGSIHIYGHIHNSENIREDLKNRFNVGVEMINYTPISVVEILKKRNVFNRGR